MSEFNDLVIGVDVGGTKVLGVIATPRGEILLRKGFFISPEADASENLEQVLALIEELYRAPEMTQGKIMGIGMGVPSVVIAPDGIVVWSPALGWRDLPLRAQLEERFGLPAAVENDVNLAALGESRFGCAQGVQNLIAIFIGTGIGSGIIVNGGLYRGHDGAAGEVGYLLPTPSDLGQTYDEFGCLESLAAGPGIVRRAKAALAGGAPSMLANVDSLTTQEVFQAARAGDRVARQVVQDTIDYLAQAVANIAAVLNPEMVVLGGGVLRAADLLLEPIKERIKGTIPAMPKIVLSELEDEGVVYGAIALAVATAGPPHSTE